MVQGMPKQKTMAFHGRLINKRKGQPLTVFEPEQINLTQLPATAALSAAAAGLTPVADTVQPAAPTSPAATVGDLTLNTGYNPIDSLRPKENPFAFVSTRARIAIYDDLLSAPRIIEINPAPVADFIEDIASSTYEYAQKLGGSLPYTVIREIAENFIHARFKECTVSILNHGDMIRFSDQGPGIEKKHLVQQPGFTSATAEMKDFIRGVGSGFPIVKEYLSFKDGYLTIEDNALDGAVITLILKDRQLPVPEQAQATPVSSAEKTPVSRLSQRCIQAMLLFNQQGILGPSDLVEPLGVSVSTSYRILEELEELGFIERAAHRKRILSSSGLAYLEKSNLG